MTCQMRTMHDRVIGMADVARFGTSQSCGSRDVAQRTHFGASPDQKLA